MTSGGFLVVWDWEAVCLSLFTGICCKKSQGRGGRGYSKELGSLNMKRQVRVCKICKFGLFQHQLKFCRDCMINGQFLVFVGSMCLFGGA